MPTVKRARIEDRFRGNTPHFKSGGDVCLNIFACLYPQFIDFPSGGAVLEVGCSEADWLTPMKASRPDLHLTGIDVRPCERPGADVLIQGDVLTHEFEDAQFDAVVFISALEHVGLGHYGDPVDPEGDTKAMARVARWMKPGGVVYFDVPWQPDPGYSVVGTSHRIYDQATLVSRLSEGFIGRAQGWTAMHDTTRLLPAMPTEKCEGFYYCACIWNRA